MRSHHLGFILFITLTLREFVCSDEKHDFVLNQQALLRLLPFTYIPWNNLPLFFYSAVPTSIIKWELSTHKAFLKLDICSLRQYISMYLCKMLEKRTNVETTPRRGTEKMIILGEIHVAVLHDNSRRDTCSCAPSNFLALTKIRVSLPMHY